MSASSSTTLASVNWSIDDTIFTPDLDVGLSSTSFDLLPNPSPADVSLSAELQGAAGETVTITGTLDGNVVGSPLMVTLDGNGQAMLSLPTTGPIDDLNITAGGAKVALSNVSLSETPVSEGMFTELFRARRRRPATC